MKGKLKNAAKKLKENEVRYLAMDADEILMDLWPVEGLLPVDFVYEQTIPSPQPESFVNASRGTTDGYYHPGDLISGLQNLAAHEKMPCGIKPDD